MYDIAIIGGGFSGTALAIHLLRTGAPVRIALLERDSALARGVAYSTTRACHLLNVPARQMSLYPDRPDDFVNWLCERDIELPGRHLEEAEIPDAFVPRMYYGAYLAERFETARAKRNTDQICEVMQTGACDIDRDSGAVWHVTCDNGATLRARYVVMATGNFAPANPPVPDAGDVMQSAAYIADPWDTKSQARLSAISSDARVLLIGTGLTMADMVMSLHEQGHRGQLTAISRHGLRSRTHKAHAPLPDTTPFEPSKMPDGLLPRFHRFKQLLREAAREGYDWRAVVKALRAYTPVLWAGLSDREKQRFLRHLRSYWDVHRHMVAPEVGACLDEKQASGQLAVHAGKIYKFVRESAAITANWHPRGKTTIQKLCVDYIINCTGPDYNFHRVQAPLWRNLVSKGHVRPDSAGIGVAVHDDGALIPADGIPAGGVYSIGTPRIGTHWETTAVPELRNQAQALAMLLAGRICFATDAA